MEANAVPAGSIFEEMSWLMRYPWIGREGNCGTHSPVAMSSGAVHFGHAR